jgi:rSAM/selenodomain-associated transferase 2
MGETSVSVVIPALNEEGSVACSLQSTRGAAERIVVDGGSRDRTREIAEAEGALVIESPPSRGLQLDAGARRASGDWLLFLHADTWLEPGWAAAIRGLGPRAAGGAFRLAIDAPGRGYRLIEGAVALRCALFRLPYGDQALFVRGSVYERLGGFAPIPLLEDVEFVRRLRREGRLAFQPRRAFTSPRRWERHGLLGATLRNWSVLALYAAGFPPGRLAGLYEGSRS